VTVVGLANLVIVPLAQDEVQAAADFYRAKGDSKLGLEFVAEFEKTAHLILANPTSGSVFGERTRRRLMRRFPYSVIYQITSDELRVIAVAHNRRRPGYWSGRQE
jgi:plasmid stabilization system protein ParE